MSAYNCTLAYKSKICSPKCNCTPKCYNALICTPCPSLPLPEGHGHGHGNASIARTNLLASWHSHDRSAFRLMQIYTYKSSLHRRCANRSASPCPLGTATRSDLHKSLTNKCTLAEGHQIYDLFVKVDLYVPLGCKSDRVASKSKQAKLGEQIDPQGGQICTYLWYQGFATQRGTIAV